MTKIEKIIKFVSKTLIIYKAFFIFIYCKFIYVSITHTILTPTIFSVPSVCRLPPFATATATNIKYGARSTENVGQVKLKKDCQKYVQL